MNNIGIYFQFIFGLIIVFILSFLFKKTKSRKLKKLIIRYISIGEKYFMGDISYGLGLVVIILFI